MMVKRVSNVFKETLVFFLGGPVSPGAASPGFSWPFLHWLGKAALQRRPLEGEACPRYKLEAVFQDRMETNERAWIWACTWWVGRWCPPQNLSSLNWLDVTSQASWVYQPFLLVLQVMVSQNQTLPQSASGGPISWPTSGTRSRRSVRSAQLSRLSPYSSFLRCRSHEHCWTLWIMPGVLIANTLPCDVQVLGFSNYALSEPVSTTERSPQAFTPPYSMTLRYGLASILWLCIGLLQVHRHHIYKLGVFWNWN